MKPTAELNVDCYNDLDFAVLWGYEDDQDPTCFRSRTGYIITIGGYPVLLSFKLQTGSRVYRFKHFSKVTHFIQTFI